MGKSCLTEHAYAYQQKLNTTFLFLTPFEPFSSAEHISVPTEQETDLPQRAPCPEDFLQSFPIADLEKVSGLLAIPLCYKIRQRVMPLTAWFVQCFESADKKSKMWLLGCAVALQPDEEGDFPMSWWFSLGRGQGGGAAPSPPPGPLPLLLPQLSQVLFIARWS